MKGKVKIVANDRARIEDSFWPNRLTYSGIKEREANMRVIGRDRANGKVLVEGYGFSCMGTLWCGEGKRERAMPGFDDAPEMDGVEVERRTIGSK